MSLQCIDDAVVDTTDSQYTAAMVEGLGALICGVDTTFVSSCETNVYL